MIKQNGKIIEATEEELRDNYYECDIDDNMTVDDYLFKMRECGVKITNNVVENSTAMSEN